MDYLRFAGKVLLACVIVTLFLWLFQHQQWINIDIEQVPTHNDTP